METIKNYLDNMFSGIVQTAAMEQLKSDIFDTMGEKYQELKAAGKSENEAIGAVISEFGNIDELIDSFQMSRKVSQPDDLPEVTMGEAEAYLQTKKKIGALIGGGVFLCILGVIVMIASTLIIEIGNQQIEIAYEPSIIGVVFLLVLVAAAVGLFIYGGTLATPYEYLKFSFYMDDTVRAQIEENKKEFQPIYTIFLVIGVALCVVSPIPVLLSQIVRHNSDIPTMIGVCVLLLLVSVGTFMLIYFGNLHEAYSKLLELGEYSKKNKKKNKVMSAISSIVWPIATIVFLIAGLGFSKWHPAWLIFPILGIIMGTIESLVTSDGTR